MYKFTDIREVHLEVTSKCQARCPMCARRPQGGKLNPNIELSEISLEQFKSWFSVDFIKQLSKLFMCGNLGDPIIAQDTLEIFEYLRKTNPNINLSMNTNGSARNNKFWKSLAELNVRTIFGIDGLNDTHSLYRIDTDFYKIIDNAKTFINNGGYAEWHMLAFEHNEHQINLCKKFSIDLGFKNFDVKHTSRFKDNYLNVLNEQEQIINVIRPTNRSLHLKNLVKDSVEKNDCITCKAKQQNQIYIASNGIVSPCCWLDVSWFKDNHQSKLDYIKKISYFPNLHINSLEEIFTNLYFEKIEETWNNDPLYECKKQCGGFDKFNEQFSKVLQRK